MASSVPPSPSPSPSPSSYPSPLPSPPTPSSPWTLASLVSVAAAAASATPRVALVGLKPQAHRANDRARSIVQGGGQGPDPSIVTPTFTVPGASLDKGAADAAGAALSAPKDVTWMPAYPIGACPVTDAGVVGGAGLGGMYGMGLDGEGEVVGVADTGLDYGSCFFHDPNTPVR